jgi:hypothetical protein
MRWLTPHVAVAAGAVILGDWYAGPNSEHSWPVILLAAFAGSFVVLGIAWLLHERTARQWRHVLDACANREIARSQRLKTGSRNLVG